MNPNPNPNHNPDPNPEPRRGGAPWKRLLYIFSLLAAALMVMSLLSLVYLVVVAVHLLQWRYIHNGKDRGWVAKLSWRFFGTDFTFTKYYALAVLGAQVSLHRSLNRSRSINRPSLKPPPTKP